VLADEAARARLAAEADRPADRAGPLAPKDPAGLYLLPPGLARYDVRPPCGRDAGCSMRIPG
jgi:N-acyl-D-amino-acid deacylase